MIGVRGRFASLLAAAAIVAMPDLGQQRTLSSRPGTGIVKRTGARSPRRDSARQAAAQAKRERKNAKRWRDFHESHWKNPCRRGMQFANGGVYGK